MTLYHKIIRLTANCLYSTTRIVTFLINTKITINMTYNTRIKNNYYMKMTISITTVHSKNNNKTSRQLRSIVTIININTNSYG